MAVANSILGELEDALKEGSPEKRVTTLRRVTDLFLHDADRLNEQQIGVFDDVLVHLIQRIENKALVQLSSSLAPLANAPIEVVRRLARDSEITIAGPVLSNSSRLAEADLIEIAKSKSQGHLLAISGRSMLSEALTDVLVERGDRNVSHRLARNSGARLSEAGFAALVRISHTDAGLAEQLGLRIDIPLQLLRQLLLRATDIVRARLLAAASPEKQDQIQLALSGIANEVGLEAMRPRDYAKAESMVQKLNREGKLNETVLVGFARENRHEEMIATLALFCGVPVDIIEQLAKSVRHDGLIVACKAAKLTWPTFVTILRARSAHHTISDEEFDLAKDSFLAISQASAQRTIRFIQVQHAAKKPISAIVL
jgi:uncharacterized protein (DUF2336 family)